MSYFFNTSFLTTLKTAFPAGVTRIKLYLYPQAPVITDATIPTYAALNRVGLLSAAAGWGPYIEGPVSNIIGGTTDPALPAGNHLLETQDFKLSSKFTEATFSPTRVMALVFTTDAGGPANDQIIFATDTPITSTNFIVDYRDSFIPALDTTTNRLVLFSWTDVPAGSPAEVLPVGIEGLVLMRPGTPDFEQARTQHVWVYPQRVNFIANPSFELATNYWRSNGTMAQIPEAPPGAGNFAARISGTTAPIVVESNIFPLNYGRRREPGVTIQLQARGSGELKVGLVSWEADYQVTNVDWGLEPTWQLAGGFSHIRTLRYLGEDVRGLLRLEFKPFGGPGSGYFDLDQVCVEPGLMPANGNDWPYFDGYSEWGTVGDYSWYGGVARHHATYSCWYNFRDSTFGRLFAWHVDTIDPNTYTDEEAAQQGLAWQWVPAGTPIESHLDVLYPNDPVSPIDPVSGSVLPYRVTDGDMGVVNPW